MKNAYKNAVNQITTPSALQQQTFNKMLAQTQRKTNRCWRKVPVAITVVCIICICGAVPVMAAISPSFNNLLSLVAPDLGHILAPVQLSCTDNGIKMQVEAVAQDGESIVAYLTMQDLEADRLDDSVDLYNYNIKGYTTFTHRQINYDAEQKKALLELSAFCGDNTAAVGKTTLSVQSFLTGQQKYKEIPVDLQLTDNPATTTAEIHGGSGDLYEQLTQRRDGWYATATVLQTSKQQKIRDDINFFFITGAGFVDGRLHIQTYWTPSVDNHGYIGLRRSNGDKIYFSSLQYTTDENWGDGNPHSKYIEYVWDITPEELADCIVYADLWADDTYLEGDWRVTFPSDTLRTIELKGKELSALDVPIQHIEISPLGITLTGNKDYLQGLQYTLSEDKHTLLLTRSSSGGSSHTWTDGDKSKLQLPATEFIDIDPLQQVQIEDKTIPLPQQ